MLNFYGSMFVVCRFIRSCSKSMLSERSVTGIVQIGWTLLVQKQQNPWKHYILYQVLSHQMSAQFDIDVLDLQFDK